LKFGISSVEEN